MGSFVKIVVCLLVCFLIWLAGLMWFVGQIPKTQTPVQEADAIIVLTGGKGRLEYGLELLSQGKGKALFISGAGKTVTREDLVSRAPADIQETIRALPENDIALGATAENTIGNAEETTRWIRQRRFHSLLLVTSNYHMPRAVLEFRKVMPDLPIAAAPVFPENFDMDGWWHRDSEFALVLSEYHKWLAGKLRHLLISSAPEPKA